MEIRQRDDLIPQLVSGLGLLFILIIISEAWYIHSISNPMGSVWAAGLVTSLPFTLWIVYAGAWLPGSFVSPSRYTRVGSWCIGGLTGFLAVNIIVMITMLPDSGLQYISWGRWAMTLGAGIGLLVGIFETRGIERAVEVERERVRAEEAKANEEFLAFLNATLRHEVLNTAQVILGNADLVTTEYDGNGTIPDRMKTIKSNTREMEAVIEDVRMLLQVSRNEVDAEPIDITELLIGEIESLQNADETVWIETAFPEQAIVQANRPLRRAFANLLWNAVEHNDSDTPTVEVTVRREPETVIVQIADNGPGIPEAERDTLFEEEIRHDSNHGLGLALTQTLIDNYDGTLEVTSTGPTGTMFTLTLPRVAETTSERTDSPSVPSATVSSNTS